MELKTGIYRMRDGNLATITKVVPDSEDGHPFIGYCNASKEMGTGEIHWRADGSFYGHCETHLDLMSFFGPLPPEEIPASLPAFKAAGAAKSDGTGAYMPSTRAAEENVQLARSLIDFVLVHTHLGESREYMAEQLADLYHIVRKGGA